jgi:GMP synthase (glutamine-hydrolysing)
VSNTVLLVTHSGAREGRVVPLLEGKGYAVEWRCPARGDRLPADMTGYAGAIVFGGAQSANDAPAAAYLQHELDWIGAHVGAGGRYLGICLGGQLLARALGARVALHPQGMSEIGYYPLRPTAAGRALIPDGLQVYHWHKEGFEVPAGAELLAEGDAFPNQAFRYGDNAYGLQFHPEVTPAVMQRWLAGNPDGLRRPGACPLERQIADSARFDAPLHAWMDGFIDRWLCCDGTARDALRSQPTKESGVLVDS